MDPRTQELVRNLQQNPLDPEAMRSVREHLAQRGKYGSLAKLLEWWAGRAPSTEAIAEGYFTAGEAVERLGKPQRAIWFFARALKSSPLRTDAYLRLEAILGAAMEHQKLAEVLEEQATALEAHGHDPALRAEVYTRLGKLRHEKLGDLDGAVEALRLAVSAVPADRGAMEQLAIVLGQRGKTTLGPEAVNDRRRAAELYTRIAKGLPQKQAIRHLANALGHAPDHEPAMALFEELVVGTPHEELLIDRWRSFVETAPDGPAVDERRRLLARAYAAAGRLADATAILQPFAAKREITAERALSDIQESTRPPTEQPVGKRKRTAISDRLSAILSALDDDSAVPGAEEDATGDFVIAPTTSRRDPTRPRSDEEETRVASPGYPFQQPASQSPYVIPPPKPKLPTAKPAPRLPEALLEEAPTRVKLHSSAPDGATELGVPSFDDLVPIEEPDLRADTVRGDPTVPELETIPHHEPGLDDKLPLPATAIDEPSRRRGARREPSPRFESEVDDRAPSNYPPDGVAPALFDDDDEDNPYLCDPDIEVESMVERKAAASSTDTGIADKRKPPVVEVIRYRHGKVLDSCILSGPYGRYGSKLSPVVVRKVAKGVSVKIREPGSGWLRRAGSGAEPIDAATSRLKLNEGDEVEIRHDVVVSHIQVVRPSPPPAGEATELPVKLYGGASGMSFGVHLFFIVILFIMHEVGVNMRVEERPPDEVFAEARLKAKKEHKNKPKPKPKPKRPKPRRKPRKLVEKDKIADTQIRIPKRARKLLNKIDKSRGNSGGDRASKAVAALTSPYAGDGQTISEVTTNIDAVKGGSASGAFKVGGTLAALEGDGVNIASGGGGHIGTLGGQVATKDAGKLKDKRGGGGTRGRVKSIKALTKVQGNLSKGEVLAVINKNMGRIQRCYEKALNAKPNLSGKVEFEWTIKVNGSVTGVRRAGSTMGDASVASCVAGILKRLKFPHPRGGPVVVKFPFMFQRVP